MKEIGQIRSGKRITWSMTGVFGSGGRLGSIYSLIYKNCEACSIDADTKCISGTSVLTTEACDNQNWRRGAQWQHQKQSHKEGQ